ncbi:hypothetical protein PKHYL_08050 [Psychrobacter sp. KH172YL61]|nr:hypothetical protein PKHYL_08050 [Psychrobacter sp. KH172YL61]
MNETRQIEHPVVEPVTTEYDNVQASVDEKMSSMTAASKVRVRFMAHQLSIRLQRRMFISLG